MEVNKSYGPNELTWEWLHSGHLLSLCLCFLHVPSNVNKTHSLSHKICKDRWDTTCKRILKKMKHSYINDIIVKCSTWLFVLAGRWYLILLMLPVILRYLFTTKNILRPCGDPKKQGGVVPNTYSRCQGEYSWNSDKAIY